MSKKITVLDNHPSWESVIGIEVHVQLSTQSKIFCTCPNGPCEIPNKNICVVCAGYPGVLPLLNEKVVEYAIMAGLGTHCAIDQKNRFARKHYFYGDLPKGYQITQSDKPICINGFIEIEDIDGNPKKIRIQRIHMEEDAGKNTHAGQYGSFVDLNRAGSPLLEIVTYPDIANSHEARSYLKELHAIVTTLGICSGNMEDGAFRGDANVSVRKKGAEKFGTKCELKNINSFKFISDAIDYEVERQIKELEAGNVIRQQTRLWDTKEKRTYVMREKEGADDYRYFNEPDIPELAITDDFITYIKNNMPELPQQKKQRFVSQYGINSYDAHVLIDDQEAGWYFEEVVKKISPKLALSWISRELMGAAKEYNISLKNALFSPSYLIYILELIENKKITQKIAQDVFKECFINGIDPREYIEKHNILANQLSESDIEIIIKKIIADNPTQLTDYKSGKIKLFGFFVGKTIAETKGAADPFLVNELLKKHLI
jgi:aspartyl-tRNA(Asn)/glutamyl-tRNA(Gln) amidotransferase subunit B